nr:lipid transfer protein earli 1 [Ipomoea batatas]
MPERCFKIGCMCKFTRRIGGGCGGYSTDIAMLQLDRRIGGSRGGGLPLHRHQSQRARN